MTRRAYHLRKRCLRDQRVTPRREQVDSPVFAVALVALCFLGAGVVAVVARMGGW